jgi:uncharacterized protein YdaL
MGGRGSMAPEPMHAASGSSMRMAQHTRTWSVLGPHMSKNPRPLGINGIKTLKPGHFKMADFVGKIARPGTTPAAVRKGHVTPAYSSTALVLYDSNTTYGWIGGMYAYQIGNLLSHFGMTVTRQGVETYKTGQLANYNCAFYVGTIYGNKLPAAFKTDVVADTNPFCWTGYNLWEIAWNAQQTGWNNGFATNYGFEFAYLDGTGYPSVVYNGTTLTKQQLDPVQGDTTIINPQIATVLATSTNGTTSVPYITRGANFWYVADNPMEYVPTDRGDDRYLAFCDILNDITGVPMPHRAQAALRIEDVSAICPSATLRSLADTLYALNVPYVVCCIPDYMDPLGVYNNGTPLEIQMQNSSQFVSDLEYMQAEGAQIIMHGVTHQYSNVPNPVNGVSADDVEFFVVQYNSNGVEQAIGPVPTDSSSWVTNRLQGGFAMMSASGFSRVVGWNTPHYFATPVDYKVFAKQFDFCMDRVLTYATDNASNLHYLIQPSPYVFTDEYGNVRVPETLGYCDPNGTSGIVNLPANMVGYANAVSCVRGGWAGMYYHWFLGTTMLQQLVQGVQAAGFTFEMPSSSSQ